MEERAGKMDARFPAISATAASPVIVGIAAAEIHPDAPSSVTNLSPTLSTSGDGGNGKKQMSKPTKENIRPMTQYCKVKEGIPEYGGWLGMIHSLVSDTKAQGRVYSVLISPDPSTIPAEQVLLPSNWLLFFNA